jgi:hypothetical protein
LELKINKGQAMKIRRYGENEKYEEEEMSENGQGWKYCQKQEKHQTMV